MGTRRPFRTRNEIEYSNGLSLGRIAKSGGKQHDDGSAPRGLVNQALMHGPAWAVLFLRTLAAFPKVMQNINLRLLQLDLVNRRDPPPL